MTDFTGFLKAAISLHLSHKSCHEKLPDAVKIFCNHVLGLMHSSCTVVHYNFGSILQHTEISNFSRQVLKYRCPLTFTVTAALIHLKAGFTAPAGVRSFSVQTQLTRAQVSH